MIVFIFLSLNYVSNRFSKISVCVFIEDCTISIYTDHVLGFSFLCQTTAKLSNIFHRKKYTVMNNVYNLSYKAYYESVKEEIYSILPVKTMCVQIINGFKFYLLNHQQP